jgi:D-alanine-D-alanine ligase
VKKLRVGVIYGGRSGEHEVSVASAASILKHLDRSRYEPVPIRIEKDGRWTLADKAPTVIKAADVIETARVQAARPTPVDAARGAASESRRARPGREAHLVAHPGDDTVLTIERRDGGTVADQGTSAVVTGLGLDVIFPVLHGPYGEDGTVQGLLELANVPYVGAGVLGSAVGMDKAVMKQLFAAHGLPQVKFVVTIRRAWERDAAGVTTRVERELGYPVFVKPANLGSSVGISKARNVTELGEAVRTAAEFDRKIVIEAAVPQAREIEVAVLGNDDPEASIAGEIVPSREFYDYEAKYVDEGPPPLIPAPITDGQMAEVRRMAIAAYRAVDCAGMARVDFLLNGETGALYLNEVNTIPGFTTISMYPKLWEATNLPYPELIDRLISLALDRHAEKQQLRTSIT